MNDYGDSAAEVSASIEAQVLASVDKAHKAYAFREEVDLLRGRGDEGSTRTREVWGNDDPVTHQMDAELDKRFAPQDPDADRDDRDRRGGR